MGTIAEKLSYLNTTKTNIKNAIVAKGVSVSENDTFRSYASKIADIEPTLGTKTITANGTYTATDDSLQGYSSVTVDIDDTNLYRDTTDSTYESVKTLSNCGAFPMLSLTAEINAVQDLHGYDKPWAGGAGKNKLPFPYANGSTDSSGIKYTVNDDGTVLANGTASAVRSCYMLDNAPNNYAGMKLNGAPSGTTTATIYIAIQYFDGGAFREAQSCANGESVTIKSSDTISIYIRCANSVQVNNVLFKPMLRLATETDDSFAPYSNICPITGWDSIDVYQSGADTSNPTTYTTALSTTCYGGSKDIKGNEIHNRVSVDLGSPTWGYTNGRFYYNPSNTKFYTQAEKANLLCTQYPPSPYTSQADNSISSYAGYIYIRADSYSGDTTAFKTAMSGVQLVYELATPTTATSDAIDLTLAEGVNNLWADSGDVGDARYFKKVEL